jgi:hypothetical protein
MAGKIIADIIEAPYDRISLNVGNTTVATMNASGLYTSTGNLVITQASQIATTAIANSAVTQAKLASNVAGNGPAFRAWASGQTTLSGGTTTKVNFATETFDTANCFSSSRFTPNVAGYYMVGATIRADNSSNSLLHAYLLFNGNVSIGGSLHVGTLSASASHVTSLIYCNGTTDYIEAGAFVATTSSSTASTEQTAFYGFLARAA